MGGCLLDIVAIFFVAIQLCLSQVMKELKEMKGSSSDKQKMMEMLSKLNKTDEGGYLNNEGNNDLSERLAGIHLDDFDQLWDRLTESERDLFQKRIQSGNLGFIKIWVPWWLSEKVYVKFYFVC